MDGNMSDKDFLEHFGILGMHWGHRKAEALKKFNEAGKVHDAKTATRDKGRQKGVSSTIKKFNEAGKVHDAKTAARDKNKMFTKRGLDISTDVLKSIGALYVTSHIAANLAFKGQSVAASIFGLAGYMAVGSIVGLGIKRRKE